METTLHRQLKETFREPNSEIEVKLGRYRIDVVNGNRLMEIQRSGLSAIRDKIKELCDDQYAVDVVKPLVSRKRLIKLNKKDGKEVDRRWSPLRGCMLDLFEELIYFTRVFPHPNLKLIIPLTEIEEIRFPGHGKRRRHRKNDFVVADRRLVKIHEIQTFERATDLHKLLPDDLPEEFDTAELAKGLGIARGYAQKIGYVLRKCGSAEEVGKRGQAILYRLCDEDPGFVKKKTKKVEVEEAVKKKVKTKSKSKANSKAAKSKGKEVVTNGRVRKVRKKKVKKKKRAA